MKYGELTSKTIGELNTLSNELKKEAFNLRVQKKFNQLTNTARMRACRRDVARINTRMNELKQTKVGS